MNRKKLLIFLFFILPLLFFIYKTNVLKVKIPEELKELVKYTTEIEKKTNGSTFSNSKIEDFNGNFLSLIDINQMNKKLFFYYNKELHCKQCVDQTIRILKEELSKEQLNNQLVILIKFTSKKEFNNFKRLNLLQNITVFKMDNEKINLPIGDTGLPFFLKLDENLKVQNSHIVIQELPELTKKYIADF
ncbi:hypothetical protein [Polaribacter sp. Hel_I_88]|uniref:hypothetical protein n=1 Tax=Polaribacter sp. Hel_I_88 TaxID=1250006 RepID=UPI00047E17B1|nr:hypothetical protein [Polaribacter sp. Hel_I_88]